MKNTKSFLIRLSEDNYDFLSKLKIDLKTYMNKIINLILDKNIANLLSNKIDNICKEFRNIIQISNKRIKILKILQYFI